MARMARSGLPPQEADSVKELDWLDPPLPYTGADIEGIRMEWHAGKRVRGQDLSSGEVYEENRPVL